MESLPSIFIVVLAVSRTTIMGAIHSTKIPTGPTGKSGPPQKVDPFFRNFSGWTEPIHWVLDRNFRKFWLNGSRPLIHLNYMYVSRLSPKFSLPLLVHCYLLLFPSITVVITITDHIMEWHVHHRVCTNDLINLFFLFLDVLAVQLTPQGNKWTNYPRTSMVLSYTVNRKKETRSYENLKTGKWKLDLLIFYQ